VVAFADYVQAPESVCEFWINLCVHPQVQGRGVGSVLYNHLLNAVLPLGPLALKARLHPARAEAVRFLTARGYRVENHLQRLNGPLSAAVTFVKLFKSNQEKEYAL
jgi:GNAT superfamily N-acetyltransferase